MQHIKIYKLAYILVFAAFFQANAYATGNSFPYEEKLKEGIEAFYQTEWERASDIFEELKTLNSADSRVYFFESMIPFWEYFFGGNSSESARKFLTRSQKAIEVSRSQLKDNPHDTTMVLMLSGLYGYRSLVAASEENYKTALQSGMTGFTYTRQLLAIDADDPRALIGKGIFYYMVGSVPKELRWATNIMGMSGSIEEGFDILEKAAASDSYISNDAGMILSYLYKREKRYEVALTHIKELCKKYPDNIIFMFHYAELLEATNQTDEAREAYQAVLESKQSTLPLLRKKSISRLQEL